ncbi:hypothetical protein VUJ49_22685 [Pseudomonas berkeleyensis]|uniref:Uncharacterized protein n=1 Tax=Pseudomonas berkeleyensis TaxID=2726956 RepID=A0A7G5DM04_9PSED|nr:hypothetical protein [Pseudomonas berkeleyensis]QMV62779.1 hypothetical protein HS968_22590 [Pseudomonas berkeleyensis]WSO38229.1 hypothetical protein VUJ49_22685 [Pseudomonas berkeleyensis]
MTEIFLDDLLDHPLDEPDAFGCTVHGLVASFAGVERRKVGEQLWPLPEGYMDSLRVIPERHVEDFGDTHLLRVPGVPELDWEAQELQAETAAGRVWQNYALLSGMGPGLFGHPLRGWVYVDDEGKRWLIQPAEFYPSPWGGQLSQSGSASLAFTVRPFGELGAEPVEPWTVSASLVDIGQANPAGLADFAGTPQGSTLLYMRVANISSAGRQLIIGLYPSVTYINDRRDLPYGFLMLSVAGTDQDIAVTLEVLRSRSQTLGQFSSTHTGSIAPAVVEPSFDVTVTDLQLNGAGAVTHAEADIVVSGYSLVPPGSRPPGSLTHELVVSLGSDQGEREVQGRIIALLFDDADQIVEFTADWESTVVREYGLAGASFSGSWHIEANRSPADGATGNVNAVLEYRSHERVSSVLRIKRGSELLQTFENQFELLGEYTWNTGVLGGFWGGLGPVTVDFLAGSATTRFWLGSGGQAAWPPQGGVPIHATWHWSSSTALDGAVVAERSGAEITDAPLVNWTWHRVAVSFVEQAATPGPYSRTDYAVQRLSNNVITGRYELYSAATGTAPTFARSPSFFAPQATMANADTGSDDANRALIRATYHPVTREIHVVTRAVGGAYPFGVWV